MNGLIYERFGIFNDDGFVKDQQKLRTNHRTLGQRRNLIIIEKKTGTLSYLFLDEGVKRRTEKPKEIRINLARCWSVLTSIQVGSLVLVFHLK